MWTCRTTFRILCTSFRSRSILLEHAHPFLVGKPLRQEYHHSKRKKMKKIQPGSNIFFISPEAQGRLLSIPKDILTVMIRLSALFCKLFQIKNTSDILYERFTADFRPENEECPFCHARGNFVSFGSYQRYAVDISDEGSVSHQISVRRVKCKNCSHTHALLPDFLIPYSQHSLSFILRVLFLYFLHYKTVEKLCTWAQITPSMLYRWKALFLKHRSLWLSALDQTVISVKVSIARFTEFPRLSVFLRSFFRKTGLSFLQSHKNPANSRSAPS